MYPIYPSYTHHHILIYSYSIYPIYPSNALLIPFSLGSLFRTIIPIVDLFNHSETPNLNWTYDEKVIKRNLNWTYGEKMI